MSEERASSKGAGEPRPPTGSWSRLYALVLSNLAILVLLFWLFTRHFQ